MSATPERVVLPRGIDHAIDMAVHITASKSSFLTTSTRSCPCRCTQTSGASIAPRCQATSKTGKLRSSSGTFWASAARQFRSFTHTLRRWLHGQARLYWMSNAQGKAPALRRRPRRCGGRRCTGVLQGARRTSLFLAPLGTQTVVG